MLLLTALLSFLFLVLGIWHFYWAFGGKYGFEASLPTKENGELLLNPRPIDSILVGVGLICFSLYYSSLLVYFPHYFPYWLLQITGWLIPSIFLLRAIGDFKYIGFFKKNSNTKFALTDTKVFTPLCIGISLSGFLIQILN